MKKIILLVLLFLFLNIEPVQAAGLVPCGGQGEASCQFCHFFVLLNNIIELVVFRLVPIFAALMLVIGGIMFFLGGAKASMLLQAKGILTSVAVGLIIIFSAWVVVNTLLTKSGIVDPVRGRAIWEWNKIECRIK
ncbi:MAG: hypothetical protein Q8P63_00355 [Candidatus Nealsonbacteria bacterium]|nr:hypothetical protein [Candidatus Nealsonbacteria bacterium]